MRNTVYTPETLLAGICNLDPSITADRLRFDEKLGYFEVLTPPEELQPEGVAIGSLRRFLAFGVPITPDGKFDNDSEVTPLTVLEDLPPAHQTVDRQSKGVGPRMYSDILGLAGMAERPQFGRVGVYMFELDPSRLLDGRAAQGKRWKQVRRHLGQRTQEKLKSTAEVVQAVHESYGDAQAVVLNVPLRGRLRQIRRGLFRAVESKFMVIRDPDIKLQRVGTAFVPWLSDLHW